MAERLGESYAGLEQRVEERTTELKESLEHQTATSEILGVIAGSPTDVKPVFDIIAERAARLCNASYSYVFRFDGELIQLASAFGVRPEGVELFRRRCPLPLEGRTNTARTIRECIVVHVADVLDDPEYELRDVAEVAGYRAALSVPLVRDDHVIGSISLARPEPGLFSDKQVELLKTFASQAVIAIENVRLFQELRARTQALSRSVEELQALGEVGQAVSSTLDLQTVLTTVLVRAAELSECDGGVIWEFHDTTQTFHVMATHRMTPDHLEAIRAHPIRLGEGAIGKAGATGSPVQVSDILVEGESVAWQVRQIITRLGIRSLLAIPFIREQRLLGGLVVWRKWPGPFAAELVNLLQTFAAQSVLAIQNARLFQEVQDSSRQLEIANQHKSQFLSAMSHELRTPLNAIIGFSEALQARFFGELNPKQAEYVDDIHASGHHLLSLINDILDLSKIEAGRTELDVTRFEVAASIEQALTLVRERAARAQLHLDVEVSPDVGSYAGDERKFRQILLNLLSNAIKFTPPGGQVRVSASRANGALQVAVSDTGIGIAPEDQAHLFEAFHRVGDRKQEGTGLGLTLTRKFVELHRGNLTVTSAPNCGSTFTVSLPIAS
jgi:signal transduction histidine kinase